MFAIGRSLIVRAKAIKDTRVKTVSDFEYLEWDKIYPNDGKIRFKSIAKFYPDIIFTTYKDKKYRRYLEREHKGRMFAKTNGIPTLEIYSSPGSDISFYESYIESVEPKCAQSVLTCAKSLRAAQEHCINHVDAAHYFESLSNYICQSLLQFPRTALTQKLAQLTTKLSEAGHTTDRIALAPGHGDFSLDNCHITKNKNFVIINSEDSPSAVKEKVMIETRLAINRRSFEIYKNI